jgi:hypothetical protein
MDALSSIFTWLGEQEATISAVAAFLGAGERNRRTDESLRILRRRRESNPRAPQ